jgi:argininosuccinate lyase
VNLVAAAIATAEFDAERLEARAGEGWTTLTELADTLVREHQLPFRLAHGISGRLIAARRQHPDRPLAQLLAEVSADLLGAPLVYSEPELATILSPRHFVNIRRTLGGPAPEVTSAAIEVSQALLDADRGWWTMAGTALAAAEQRLAAESARL